jgi:molybdopterin-guanine dinucleotide biosynthesis protein MobB
MPIRNRYSKRFTLEISYHFLVIEMDHAVIGFYGKSGSGKTSLIENLIKKLNSEGLKVATIKTTNKKISIDTQGKDTLKYNKAGSRVVVFSSPIETDFLVKEKLLTDDILKQIKFLDAFDIILIEGANDPDIPKIRLGDIEERENTIHHYTGDFEKVMELIKKKINKKLKDKIDQKVELKVNGKIIPLTYFPSDFIKTTIVGMLKSLKGVSDLDEVDIHFKL